MNAPQDLSLQQLIETAITKRDSSIRGLTQLAQNEGFKVNHTTLGQLRNGSYKYDAPSHDTIRAIAWMAGVPESVAFTAAGQPVPGPPLADELPPGADNLSPKARKTLIDLARVLIEYEQDATNAQVQQPDITKPHRLRAVAATDHPRPEQKKASGDEPAASDDIELELDQLGIPQIHGDEADNYPPPPLDQAAAHPPLETSRKHFDRLHGDRGEESQDPSEGGPHE
ncbi:hypothetical protein ACX8Z7_07945 [Glutamicibacter endophyticus]